jgi:hypothetical protein
MPSPRCVASLSLATALVLAAMPAPAQQVHDSSAGSPDSAKAAAAAHPWRGKVRYGGGPSVGAPPSDFMGETPPSQWCLQATGRAPGDFGVTGQSWTEASRSWLRQVLGDTTELGAGWRKVPGGAPSLATRDSIVQVTDEGACRDIAEIINRGLLGWQVGPPPVVVFRVRDYLIAYPSNARMGEFGFAVGMSLRREIRGVATW